MLYHLQNFQLGPYDDVYANALGGELLFYLTYCCFAYRFDRLGIKRLFVSRKILGAFKPFSQVLGVY